MQHRRRRCALAQGSPGTGLLLRLQHVSIPGIPKVDFNNGFTEIAGESFPQGSPGTGLLVRVAFAHPGDP